MTYSAHPRTEIRSPSGKATLAQEADRLRLDLERHQAAMGNELVVLDEAQAWLDVFPWLRNGAIDQNRRRAGRFPLLGSVSPALMTQVSEPLAVGGCLYGN